MHGTATLLHKVRAVRKLACLAIFACAFGMAALVALARGGPAASALVPPGPQAAVIHALSPFFCKPRFTIDLIARPSGTGFLLEGLTKPRRTYLLTAQHLFSAPWRDMPRRVTSAECASPLSGEMVAAGAAIAIPGAHPMGLLSQLRDVAAFPLRRAAPGLRLASHDVWPGDDVWLMALPASGREVGLLLHHARVGRSEGFLAYAFDDASIGLDQTSGAAVLNAAGEVVSLNVGYGHLPSGQIYGVGNRLATLRQILSTFK